MAIDDRGAVSKSPVFSVVILTFGRDSILQDLLKHLASILLRRNDYELILVDNNPDSIDRGQWLSGFSRSRYVKLGRNRGVSARNEGMRVAQGRYFFFVDDDSLVYPENFLDLIQNAFERHPTVGILTSRIRNYYTQEDERRWFPHTNKKLPRDKPIKTFRFLGSGFSARREVIDRVGMLDEAIFFGAEEFDYAYRAIKHGFEILYYPSVSILEKHVSSGRRPAREIETMRLRNKFIVSYRHLPLRHLIINIPAYSLHMTLITRGKVSVIRALVEFLRWRKSHRHERRPMDAAAIAYIRACGGQLWK